MLRLQDLAVCAAELTFEDAHKLFHLVSLDFASVHISAAVFQPDCGQSSRSSSAKVSHSAAARKAADSLHNAFVQLYTEFGTGAFENSFGTAVVLVDVKVKSRVFYVVQSSSLLCLKICTKRLNYYQHRDRQKLILLRCLYIFYHTF